MHRIDPNLFRQLTLIHQIIEDETWLEGERRGCWVSLDDPVVRENVGGVVRRIERETRDAVASAVAAESGAPGDGAEWAGDGRRGEDRAAWAP